MDHEEKCDKYYRYIMKTDELFRSKEGDFFFDDGEHLTLLYCPFCGIKLKE